jgi:predicted tellurium resistance membrane protein TerC
VLGLDNLVFIALLSNRIDEQRRGLARGLGLSLALLFRLALLASASWAARLSCRGRGHESGLRSIATRFT